MTFALSCSLTNLLHILIKCRLRLANPLPYSLWMVHKKCNQIVQIDPSYFIFALWLWVNLKIVKDILLQTAWRRNGIKSFGVWSSFFADISSVPDKNIWPLALMVLVKVICIIYFQKEQAYQFCKKSPLPISKCKQNIKNHIPLWWVLYIN